MTAQQQRGLAWALTAAFISGISVFANSLVVKGIDPLVHTTVKNGVAGILVMAVLLATRDVRLVKKLTIKQLVVLLSIAVVGGSFAFALFFTGLKMIGATQGTLIQKTLVIWIALMAVPLLKERVSWKMVGGILMLYASSLMVGVKGFTGLGLGHALVLMATLLWAVENIIAKIALKDIPVNIVVAARMGVGSILLLTMTAWQQKLPLIFELTGQQWWLLSIVGILLFGYVMSWYRALKILPATVTASVIVGATIVTTMLDALFVSHIINASTVIQSGLIITGIYILVLSISDTWQKKLTPAITEH